MAKITDLPHIKPEVRQKLGANKIKTTESLWRRVGQEFHAGVQSVEEDFDTSVQKVAKDLRLEAADIEAVLREGEWLQEHPREYRLLTVIPVFVVAAALAVLVIVRLLGSMTVVEQVVTVNGLAAFQVIEADDVKLLAKPATNKGVEKISDVVGYYLLSPVGKDQVIQQNQLSSVTLDASSLQDRVIVAIPLPSSSLNPNVTAGARVELVFSSRTPGSEGRLMDALRADAVVLKLDDQNGSFIGTFAIMSSAIDAVAKALGSSDIYIVQPVP